MPSPSPRPLVDRLIPGGLEQFLRDARTSGQSGQTIAGRLAAEHDISVSVQTVLTWCDDYGIAKVVEA